MTYIFRDDMRFFVQIGNKEPVEADLSILIKRNVIVKKSECKSANDYKRRNLLALIKLFDTSIIPKYSKKYKDAIESKYHLRYKFEQLNNKH